MYRDSEGRISHRKLRRLLPEYDLIYYEMCLGNTRGKIYNLVWPQLWIIIKSFLRHPFNRFNRVYYRNTRMHQFEFKLEMLLKRLRYYEQRRNRQKE